MKWELYLVECADGTTITEETTNTKEKSVVVTNYGHQVALMKQVKEVRHLKNKTKLEYWDVVETTYLPTVAEAKAEGERLLNGIQ